MAPGVLQIDSGELAAVQYTLGIAHPTGYPLFTLIGYLFLKIPLPFTKIFQANLLAAIWCTLGIYFFIKSSQLIFNNTKFTIQPIKKKGHQKDKALVPPMINGSNLKIASFYSGLVLAFSKTYWFQSTSVEVYSLQIFLFMLIIFFTLNAYYSTSSKINTWLYVAIVLAFGFSNHMTTMLTLPLVAILFFNKEKFRPKSFLKIFYMLAVFLPILILFYSFLPLRASSDPQFNWGNPINFENLLRHISGKQYQVWLFASAEAAKKQFLYYLQNLPGEFVIVGLVFGLIGLQYCFKLSKKIFFAVLTTFVLSILYSINYDIVDIDSYFLLSYITFSFFISFGILKTLNYIDKKYSNNKIIETVFGLIILIPFFGNVSIVNQSGVKTFEEYTKAVLTSIEKKSIVLSYQWDYLISPSYYFQAVENFRPDVVIIDKELLRRSWYYNQLQRNYPDVTNNISSEINNFIKPALQFERGELYDSQEIESAYRAVMTNLIAKNIDERNCYIGMEIFQNEIQRGEFSLPEGYFLVPYQLMFKVVKGNEYVPAPDPNFIISIPENRNKYIDFIEQAAGVMLSFRAAYELQFNKPERAKVFIEKVKKDFPKYQIPYEILSRVK
jgi:hypothetical protein